MTFLSDRYHILRTLGKGGFGETFLAEDTQMPSGRYCVVKLLKPTNHDPTTHQIIQERFQREAAILEELGEGQAQIPSLYAYFESGGEFYLVQEYIEGKTLNQQLQQQGLFSESRVRELLIHLLPILAYIHDKRIIHRDIKPDNVILRNSDNRPVLIDLGAVKETMNTTMTASNNSNHSIVIGTPGFMPSEQSIGRPIFSSDLYSLGLTAIYLLTGKNPQELQSDPMTGAISWRQEAPAIDPILAAILDKAIQPHSRDRYHTVPEMLNALQTETSPNPAPIPATVASNNIPGTVVSPPPASISKTTSEINRSSFSSYIGWIRIGAVANQSGNIIIGETLISTTQRVTINPKVVPSIGQKVKVINNVNYRINYPQAPQYKLAAKKGELFPNQELIILNLKSFVDPTVSSSYTVVWAEVGLP